MLKNNKNGDKEGLLSIDDMIVSESIASNEKKKDQEKDYESINNLDEYYKEYEISNDQPQEKTFDQLKRKAIFKTKNSGEVNTNKKINQEESNNNIVLRNDHKILKNKRSDKKLKDIKDNHLVNERKYILKYLL